MSKIFLASTFAAFLCASLAAQAPATQSTTSSAKAEAITVQGCIEPSVNAVSVTRDAVGTTGSSVSTATAFILTSAIKPVGTSGSTASAPIAPTYQLDVEDSKLIPHVGHKVEINGTLVEKPPTTTAAQSAPGAPPSPTLKVNTVKMIAATCTP